MHKLTIVSGTIGRGRHSIACFNASCWYPCVLLCNYGAEASHSHQTWHFLTRRVLWWNRTSVRHLCAGSITCSDTASTTSSDTTKAKLVKPCADRQNTFRSPDVATRTVFTASGVSGSGLEMPRTTAPCVSSGPPSRLHMLLARCNAEHAKTVGGPPVGSPGFGWRWCPPCR